MSQIVIPEKAPTLSQRLTVFGHALLFVLGFTVVFVVGWGGAITLLGELFGRYKVVLAQMGGVIIILFGLSTLGLFKLPWMYYDTRPQWQPGQRGGWLASSLMGVFFAAGWTPCVGATLGAILTLGLSQQTVGQSMVLSGVYALGLGLPFLAIGLGLDRAAQFVRRFRKHTHTVEIITGLFLILIGLMMLSNNLNLISIWAQRNGWYLDFTFGDSSAPGYPVALLAGLLSFLSPCVLPLVPAYVGYLSGHALGGAKNSES